MRSNKLLILVVVGILLITGVGISILTNNKIQANTEETGTTCEHVDTDSNCVCDTCGAELEHKYSGFSEYTSEDGSTKKHGKECTICGAKTEEHDFKIGPSVENGICAYSGCGLLCSTCNGQGTTDVNGCGTCGRRSTSGGTTCEHVDTDSNCVCDTCEEELEHQYSGFSEYTSATTNTKRHGKVCTVCKVQVTEDHDFVRGSTANGICAYTGCGLPCTECGGNGPTSGSTCSTCGMGCQHYDAWITYSMNRNDYGHIKYCTSCSSFVGGYIVHSDSNNDNSCDTCGYILTTSGGDDSGCIHGIVEWDYDDNEHWKKCSDSTCGEEITGTRDVHDWSNEDGECTDCEMKCPTCNGNGPTTGECATCGKEVTGSGTTHTHTPKTTYEKDANGHWKICSDTTCNETVEAKVPHSDTNTDGACDVCGYTMSTGTTCEHTNQSDDWYKNKTEHYKICEDCGEKIESTREAHNYVNGVCTVCQRPQNIGCSHTGIWCKDKTQHWQLCEDCGEEIAGTRDSHTYENGVCECGRKENIGECSHTNKITCKDKTHHWEVCEDCGEQTGIKVEHTYTNGACTCGRKENIGECPHTNKIGCKDKTHHWEVCEDCGEQTGTKVEHTYTNGACTCGRKENIGKCPHTNKIGCKDKTHHWQMCEDCGEQIGTKDTHTYENGECACGRKETVGECPHTNKTICKDKTHHWEICEDCGEEIEGTKETHNYKEGKCEECKREENVGECSHTNKKWKSNENEHWQVCEDCGEIIEGTKKTHSYKDGKCECGTKDGSSSGSKLPDTGVGTIAIVATTFAGLATVGAIKMKKYKDI